jgi:UPF0148 protein
MTSNERLVERRKMTSTADLIRRGATLLNEPCPRCGGVQIRFRDKVYCINEDDIDSILSSPVQSSSSSRPRIEPIVQPVEGARPAAPTRLGSEVSSENTQLRKTLEEKLSVISKQLETSQDFEQQAKLLDLISRYLETLEKLKRASA